MVYFWLCLAVASAVIELATPQLVSLWFCVGALLSLLCASLNADLWIQITVFVVSSVALVFITRPLYKKHIQPKLVPTNTDALIGQVAIVTQAIDNIEATGLTKVSGQIWSAQSENGCAIAEGEKVIIKAISGVKLIVALAEDK